MLTIRELSDEQWQKGELQPLAVLPWEPQDMVVNFADTYDDLDYLKAAYIELSDGWRFALKRYRGSPTRGVAVYVVAKEFEMPRALASLMSAFDLQADELSWVSPLAKGH
jgi:hypothetical protein